MADSPHIVQLDEANFVEVVVEGSASRPVLVDFWADWCGPCKALMPILEKLAIEYDGGFTLAKLDTEAHPGIAQQLGIKSLPTVKLFKDRQLVDEFMGALPEPEVRAFLDKHVTADTGAEQEEPGDHRVEQAMALYEAGDHTSALEQLKALQAEEPENTEILLSLGQVCVASGDLDTADSCVGALSEEASGSSAGKRLKGMLALARESSEDSSSTDDLRSALQSNPNNSDARYKLALHEAMDGNVQSALDDLLIVLQKDPDYGEGAAQKKLIELFDVLGEDPMVGVYRRKMFAMLH